MSKNVPPSTSDATNTAARRLSALRRQHAKRQRELQWSKKIYQQISEQLGWFTPEDIAALSGVPVHAANSRLNLMLRQRIVLREEGRFRLMTQPEPPSDRERHLSMLMGNLRYQDFIPRRLQNAG